MSSSDRITKKLFKQLVEQRPYQIHTPTFILKSYPLSTEGEKLFTVVVSSKVSKRATDRNLIKRRVRSIWQEIKPLIKSGFAVIIITKPASVTTPFTILKTQVNQALNEAKLLN